MILALIIMSAFEGVYFCIYKSLSREAVITSLFLGILSLLSSKLSDEDLKEYSTMEENIF